ncbi:hypothetical protein PIROE2DRAFT_3240 [Piromyces sp. E2]|nr:hypothetical protein PIROE2DRAFT_3240 [Piromyces sp. E2]|eukprot:OUM69001.1 hypothetical protein PIROE2DRAFT_3240 [Piromyces sp. E2]
MKLKKKEKEKEKISGKKGYMDGLIRNLTKEKTKSKDNIILKAKTKSNVINIEIQVLDKGNMFKRSLFYCSSIIMHSLTTNTAYDSIPDLIMINLLCYNVYENKNKYHWTYGLIERELKKEDEFCKMLNFHFIELKKFETQINKKNVDEESKNKLIQSNPWLYFIKNPNDKYFRNKETPNIFKEAREKLLSLQVNPEFYIEYVKREMEFVDTISGEKRGEKRVHIEHTLLFLNKGTELNEIKSYKWVSDNELDILNNFLNNKNENREVIKLAEDLNIDEDSLKKILDKLKIPYINKIKRRKL